MSIRIQIKRSSSPFNMDKQSAKNNSGTGDACMQLILSNILGERPSCIPRIFEAARVSEVAV